ncbi:MAG: single-stranded-DNA-specific exonuclease RecJ [Proteobacteria bacterium]|nr:single-stranded-DNA-specific exonuclease RecJ [Pseudomonadota bacterium]
MNRTWTLRPPDLEISHRLMKQLNLSPPAAQILSTREVRTPEQGERFISPSLSHLHSPFLMKDMDRAVDRLMEAVINHETIMVYGDYDVDGITSTTILVAFLRELGVNPRYYIPHRVTEGYGLNIESVKRFGAEGVNLLITADCGVSNRLEIQKASELGMDTLVIDHHEIPDDLPPARAILNPKQKDCPFPFDRLSGVGVAFQVLIGLRVRLRERGYWQAGSPPNLKKYLDLVCLGTIADMVPLLDENRILVKFGLEELTSGRRTGIKALKAISGLEKQTIKTGHVAFKLSPRLNACGRLDYAGKAVELLLTESDEEANRIASDIDRLNSQRQIMEDQILDEILRDIERFPEVLRRSSLLFSSSHWHPGVIGIVASRLVERFGKAAFLIAVNQDNLGRGSARSTDGLDLYQTLLRCRELLVGFGGHRAAAGFTIRSEFIEDLRNHLESVISKEVADKTIRPEIAIDVEVTLEEIDRRLIEDLIMFEPHGVGNPRPLFLSKNVAVCDSRIVGADSLKLKVKDKQIFDAIGFRMADRLPLTSGPIDLVFVPQLNQWMGSEKIQLEVKDLAPHTAH